MTDNLIFHAELKQIADFFTAPGFDVSDPRGRDMAIFDIVEARAETETYRATPSITLYLPPEQITAETEASFDLALQRLIEARQFDAHSQRQTKLRMGLAQVPYALLIVFLVFVVVAVLYLTSTPFVYTLAALIGMIAAWVAIWMPVELLLFDNLPQRRTYLTLNRMKDMEVTIKPAPMPESVDGQKI